MFVRVGWQKVMLDPRLPRRSGLPVQTFHKWTRTNIHLFGVPISTRKCLYGSMIWSEKEPDVCTCRLLRRMADPYKHFSGPKKGWARDVGTGPLSGWKVGPAYFFKKFSDVDTGRVRRNVCTGHCKRHVQTMTCPTLPPPPRGADPCKHLTSKHPEERPRRRGPKIFPSCGCLDVRMLGR